MSTTLQTVIDQIRGVHPALVVQRVPDKTIGDLLGRYQRELVQRALMYDETYLAQTMSIALQLDAANAAGTAGAGTTGGVPADVTQSSLSIHEGPAGALITYDWDNAVELVADFVPVTVTSTTVKKTSAGWTVNAYANKWVDVTAGPGLLERRLITSNTADTLTLSQAFTSIPTALVSTVRVVNVNAVVSTTASVVTSLPTLKNNQGYLVKLDATGTPYVDLSTPVLLRIEEGIPLPPHYRVLGGTVRYTNEDRIVDLLAIGTYATRGQETEWPSGSMLNGQLYLSGISQDWLTVSSIDVRYVPIPSLFTARTEYFLVPDNAVNVLVAQAIPILLARVSAFGVQADPTPWLAEKQNSEQSFMDMVAAQARNRVGIIREVM